MPQPFQSITYRGLGTGPRLIITGAVHGNETCGTEAIRRVLKDIDAGALSVQAGLVTFVPVTNPLAYERRERAGDRNLNRNLEPTDHPADYEDHVANWLCPLLSQHEVLLDLHSTRAQNPAFAMLGPPDNDGPVEPFRHFARERGLALRLGVKRFVHGWLSTYAAGVARRAAAGTGTALNSDPRYGVGTTEYMRSQGGYAITLECGQHDDPESVEVGYRAIHRTLAHLGISGGPAPAPETRYEALHMYEVIDRNDPADAFARAWASFDPLRKGDLIATRADGTRLVAAEDGCILFPDAMAEPGNEWFYLTKAVDRID